MDVHEAVSVSVFVSIRVCVRERECVCVCVHVRAGVLAWSITAPDLGKEIVYHRARPSPHIRQGLAALGPPLRLALYDLSN